MSSVFEEQLLDPKRHAHQNMRKGISQTWLLVPHDQPSTIAALPLWLARRQRCVISSESASRAAAEAQPIPSQ